MLGAGAVTVAIFLDVPHVVQHGGDQCEHHLPVRKHHAVDHGSVQQACHGKKGIRRVTQVVEVGVAGLIPRIPSFVKVDNLRKSRRNRCGVEVSGNQAEDGQDLV